MALTDGKLSNMSYKAAANMKPILCLLNINADVSVASGNPIPWIVNSGTSGHGVSTSNGVITLTSGYHWFAQSQVSGTTITATDLNWYVDNSASTLFQETGIKIITSPSTSSSNLVAHCYIDASTTTVDLELRTTNTITAEAITCSTLLIGYPT